MCIKKYPGPMGGHGEPRTAWTVRCQGPFAGPESRRHQAVGNHDSGRKTVQRGRTGLPGGSARSLIRHDLGIVQRRHERHAADNVAEQCRQEEIDERCRH